MAHDVIHALGRKSVAGMSAGNTVAGLDSPLLRRERENLFFTLRQVRKQNSSSDSPTPYPAKMLQKIDAAALELNLAVFAYVGDVQLRFVFVQSNGDKAIARMQDLEKLELTPEQAFATACDNLKRNMPAPRVMEQPAGFYQVGGGGSVDQNTDFWFVRSLWLEQAKRFQSALIVAFPRRGAVLFAPHNDAAAVAAMRKRAQELYANAGEQRISGMLFGFTGKQWKVFAAVEAAAKAADKAATAAPLPAAVSAAAAAATGSETPPLPRARTQQQGARRSGSGGNTSAPTAGNNPYRKPAADVQSDSEFEGESAYSDEAIEDIISGQKAIIRSVLGSFLLSALSATLPLKVLALLALAVLVYGVHGVIRICRGAELSTTTQILSVLGILFPLTGLIVLVVLNRKASAILRDEGFDVGFFGAKD